MSEQPEIEVSVVIPTRGNTHLVKQCLRALFTDADEFGIGMEVIVVEHQTTEVKAWLVEDDLPVIYLGVQDAIDKKWSYSSLNNHGASQATGKYLLLLNNDCFIRKGCLGSMLGVLDSRPEVGVVGGKLLMPNGRVQHVGVTVNRLGVPGHVGYNREDNDDFEPGKRGDYYHAVTFACAMIRRDLWNDLGGLDPAYFFNYEDTDFCLRALERGQRTWFEPTAIAIHREGASEKWRRTPDHSRDRNLLVFMEKWFKPGRLQKLLGTGFAPLEQLDLPGPRQLTRVAMFPASQSAGVSWWRMLLPARKIMHKGLMNLRVIYNDQADADIMESMEKCQLAVWQAHYGDSLLRLAQMRDVREHRMIYELDDHPIYLSPYSQAYQALGTQEVKIREAKTNSEEWLWRDGENGFNLQRNRAALAKQLEIIHLVDAVTTTTGPLQEYLRTMNGQVYVLPNCIDFDFYPPMHERFVRRPGGKIRIGWWGGDNHWHDISSVGRSLVEFVNSRDDVELVLIGAYYRGPLKGLDPNKVREEEWRHVEAFPYVIATMALDVVFVPLANPGAPMMQFNRFKSEIKWLEASAYQIPSLVQAGVEPYHNCVDGVNALTFADEHEFVAKLENLCGDPELRARIGLSAYDWTRAHRNLDTSIEKWVQAYEEVAALQHQIDAPAPAAVGRP